MTIEEEFFKAFGIEKNKLPMFCSDCIKHCLGCKFFINNQRQCYEYPEITAEKLLELICILNSINGVNCTAYESKNADDLKIEILRECLQIKDDNELKVKVRKLFEE